MPQKFTKIVATISDRRCEIPFIQQLYNEGMNVARLNTAHMTPEGFDEVITNIRAVSSKIAILVDTKGPEIRTTANENDEGIVLKTGNKINVIGDPSKPTTSDCIYVSHLNFVQDLSLNDQILIDDGEIELVVVEKKSGYLTCEILNDAKLGSRKSINVPGVRINLPSLTEKDKNNIIHSIKREVDFIAHSFVRNRQDVIDVQKILDEHHSKIKIIAKIENQEGVDNIDEILEHAYGVMVARGDLGIEVPQEKIPGIQRVLIRKCVLAHKPVIVATQMLHSMIENPRPTRAEITDIANAIFYRTDALMLSGETAYGKYPVEAVRTMAKIAEEAEKTKLSDNDIRIIYEEDQIDIVSYLAKSAIKATESLGTEVTITDSITGKTARILASYRAKKPVLAICYNERATRLMALSYGVFPIFHQEPKKASPRENLLVALKNVLENQCIDLNRNDLIAYLSGNNYDGSGATLLEINRVEKIFADSERKDNLLPD